MVKIVEKSLNNYFLIAAIKGINKNKLTQATKKHTYNYITRTTNNNGVSATTGLIEGAKLNPANTFCLNLLQMKAFLQEKPWYAGQFVRLIKPKYNFNKETLLYFQVLINCIAKTFDPQAIKKVDKLFNTAKIKVPVTPTGELDTAYMASYVQKIEASYVQKIEAYLAVLGYKSLADCKLNEHDLDVLHNKPKKFVFFKLNSLFPHIKQGKRLRKQDQISGNIPFIMSGETNQGFVKFIKNNLNLIPKNSLTIDILGNVFYRNYEYSISDDVGAYWSDKYTTNQMLYLATSIKLAMLGKFSYGKKFRSSRSNNINVALPVTTSGKPDYTFMEDYITAIEKLKVIKIKQYLDQKLLAYQELTK